MFCPYSCDLDYSRPNPSAFEMAIVSLAFSTSCNEEITDEYFNSALFQVSKLGVVC